MVNHNELPPGLNKHSDTCVHIELNICNPGVPGLRIKYIVSL